MPQNNQLQEEGKSLSRDHVWFLDVLRIVSCIAVVVFHVAALWCGTGAFIPKAYHYLTEFPVPIFLMVSGALFLNPEKGVSLKRLWKNNILKLVILYFAWSFGYNIKNILALDPGDMGKLPALLVEGWYHMWYLPTAIGLYILVPLLRPVVEDKTRCIYFLVLSFMLNQGRSLLSWVPSLLPLHSFLDKLGIANMGSPVFYFVLGYMLSRYPLEKKWNRGIYAAAVILQTAALAGIYKNTDSELFVKLKTIATLVFIVAIFLFVKSTADNRKLTPNGKNCIRTLSGLTLGVYLIHPLVTIGVDLVPFDLGKVPFLLLIPCVSIATILVSAAVIWLLKKLPVINSWLV